MFKVGDKVKCISDMYPKVNKDEICTVAGVKECTYRPTLISLKGEFGELAVYQPEDFEKIKTVYAKETSNFYRITQGKAYDVLKEFKVGPHASAELFYTMKVDDGSETDLFACRFSEEPPKEEPKKEPELPKFHRCIDCEHSKVFPLDKPCVDCSEKNKFIAKPKFVVLVYHKEDPSKRPYIFGVPKDVTIKKDDILFADTRCGKAIVIATTDSFELSEQSTNELSKFFGARPETALKYVTGEAVEVREVSWKEVPFNSSDLPF